MSKRLFVYWIIYSLSFTLIELLFALFTDFDIISFSRLRVILFAISTGLFMAVITSLFNKKWSTIFLYGSLFTYSFYTLFQSSFYDYMGYYLSLRTAKTTAMNVTDFIFDFITSIKIHYLLYFLPTAVLFIAIKTKFLTLPIKKLSYKQYSQAIVLVVLVHLLSLQSLNWFVTSYQIYTPKVLYSNPSHAMLAIQEYGVNRYGVRDFLMMFKDSDDEIIINPNDPINPDPTDDPVEEPDLTRVLKTQLWENLARQETNQRIKRIDEYLLSKTVTNKNEMTGVFENKNLVYIMVEAFDYMAIHPQLTPTIYNIMQNGWFFDNYYAVKGSCATGESEFMGLTALIPSVSVCSPYEYYQNTFSQSAFNLFKKQGYHVSSYHSYPDQFYPRTPWHANMGSEWFYHSNQLKIPMLKGWPSDLTLFEKSYEVYSKQEKPFMAFVITAAMHFFYDTDTTLGNRYLDEVNRVMPHATMDVKRYMSKSIDFDRGLARLFQLFEEDDLMDDTVFVIYADHHPFRIPYTDISKNTTYVDRSTGLSIDRSPLLIYHKGMEPQVYSMPSSQIDILPTLANLFDLSFDPRVYIGQDLFSDLNNIVIFTSGSWKTSVGEFNATRQTFTPYDENMTYTNEEIFEINQYVKNQFTISDEILKTDYFKLRKVILP